MCPLVERTSRGANVITEGGKVEYLEAGLNGEKITAESLENGFRVTTYLHDGGTREQRFTLNCGRAWYHPSDPNTRIEPC